jgi:hypothetical protein
MGKASTAKRDRKVAQTVASMVANATDVALAKVKGVPDPTPLRWLTKVGAASVAFGVLGMISSFFWPSVIAIYAGCVLLIFDLWYEKFGGTTWFRRNWFRITATIVFFLGLYYFSTKIVLHRSPLLMSYSADGSHALRFSVANWSSDYDISELDLRVSVSGNLFIRNAWPVSKFGSCTIYPPLPGHFKTGDRVLATSPNNVPSTQSFNLVSIASVQKIRCESLPRDSVLEVGLFVVDGKDVEHAIEPDRLSVLAKYKGQFKPFEVSEDIRSLSR